MPLPKDSGMIHDHIQRRVLDHEQGAANSFDRVCRTQCHIRDENTQIIVTIPTRGAVGIRSQTGYIFSASTVSAMIWQIWDNSSFTLTVILSTSSLNLLYPAVGH